MHHLGAQVSGLALPPQTEPSLFQDTRAEELLSEQIIGDIRALDTVTNAINAIKPEVVFHLAAQSIVREGYADPVGTFATNVLGTAHILEACRHSDSVRAVIIVTSDKCYANREWPYAYRENDPLGGHDPYSASKAGAEIVTSAYRTSFFNVHTKGNLQPAVTSVRAGNVIGGGDWADDRLLPDCVRSFMKGEAVRLRFPHAKRPWLYVLEPLSGYLQLAQRQLSDPVSDADDLFANFNFGPDPDVDANVRTVADRVAQLWGGDASVVVDATDDNPHEANLLKLDTSKVRSVLGWKPRLSLDTALESTVTWYKAWSAGENMRDVSLAQIAEYEQRCSR